MMEDLYTDRFTVRQLRKSYLPHFDFDGTWRALVGPGIKMEKNYLICPSSAFCGVVLPLLNTIINDPMGQLELHQCIHEYCRRYPLTMLIRD